MSERNVARDFLKIFQGRTDAWGGDTGRANYAPVTEELIQGHLDGSHEPIGIYPIRFVLDEESEETMPYHLRVRWGCCDLDDNIWANTYALARTLYAMDLNPWVERSRSKGWHVWIFVPESVAAFDMRRALKVAYSVIGLPAKEANPKSELLHPNQLGNYVRLPYPYGSDRRQVMMEHWEADNDGYPMDLWSFLDHPKERLYSDPAKVRHWATKWHEPKRLTIVSDMKEGEADEILRTLPKGVRNLYESGPKIKEGKNVADTSSGLVGLAHMCASHGLSAQDTYTVVAAADRRWGKYHMRNDPELYYEDIVRRAF